MSYRCDGFCKLEVVPSPKFHRYDVITPVDASVNWTDNGAVPEVGVPENPATGALFTAATVMETVAVLESAVPSFALKVNESEPK